MRRRFRQCSWLTKPTTHNKLCDAAQEDKSDLKSEANESRAPHGQPLGRVSQYRTDGGTEHGLAKRSPKKRAENFLICTSLLSLSISVAITTSCVADSRRCLKQRRKRPGRFRRSTWWSYCPLPRSLQIHQCESVVENEEKESDGRLSPAMDQERVS